MVALRGVGRQVERGEDGAEKQPRAHVARDQIRVLALPADAGRFGERLLHHRRGIDEDFDIAAGFFDEPASEAFQPRPDHVVIIVALGVDRDGAMQALPQDRQRIVIRAVIDAEHDDRAHVRPQHAGIAAPIGVSRHPVHVAVGAGGEEVAQPLGSARDRVRPRDTDRVEALRAGGLDERRLERGRASEVEIGVVRRRRQTGQRLAKQGAERGSRFDPRVPGLGGLVFVPRHIAQIIDGGQMRRRG